MARKASLTTEVVVAKATEIVKESGFNALSYRGLARALNVQPQTLYRYVANIEELQVQVILTFLDELIQYTQSQVIGFSGNQAILKFAQAVLTYSNHKLTLTSLLSTSADISDKREIKAKLMALRELPAVILKRQSSKQIDASGRVQMLMSLILGFAEYIDIGLYDGTEEQAVALLQSQIEKMLISN